VRLLVDTHAFLWWIAEDARLSMTAGERLKDRANEVFVSMVSVWEIAIKVGIGRLRLPGELGGFLADQLAISGFAVLPITFDHAVSVHALPMHHRDPFDRLLIAQSRFESLPLVSLDTRFSRYDVELVW
jgi:PIN domain nuclease of toxin-antitoxin system